MPILDPTEEELVQTAQAQSTLDETPESCTGVSSSTGVRSAVDEQLIVDVVEELDEPESTGTGETVAVETVGKADDEDDEAIDDEDWAHNPIELRQ